MHIQVQDEHAVDVAALDEDLQSQTRRSLHNPLHMSHQHAVVAECCMSPAGRVQASDTLYEPWAKGMNITKHHTALQH